MKERELRLLLTQKCNFNCGFCHKEGVPTYKEEILNTEDYEFVFNTLKTLYGWNTVSVTGGEPLCRKGVEEILERLYNLGAKITLVTNGSLLDKHVDICKWLEKITVSVHTTDNAKYQEIIGRPFALTSLMQNLSLAREKYPNANLRFNCTVVKGVNSSEENILDIIKFAKKMGASIKFIELLPETKEDDENFVPIEEVEKILVNHNYKLIENGLLQKIYFDGESVIVLARIVCSVSRHLGTATPHCTATNSIFLAADGTIKPCMKNSFEINVLQEIKNRDIINFEKKIKIFFSTVAILCPYEK